MHTLSNGWITVKVKQQGAELSSVFNHRTGLEYIWQAGNEWPKHAPILFPFVGSLKDNAYIYNGIRYPMGRHGFAREKNFLKLKESEHSVTYRLQWSKETLRIYPFKFILDVQFSISEDKVDVHYAVANEGDESMLFSIGSHPAFRIPLHDSDNYDDYYLQFNKKETTDRLMLKDGLIYNSQEFAWDETISLSHDLFNNDALVFRGIDSDCIRIKSKRSKNGVELTFHDHPYLGIWSAGNADFICIEPWHGIADIANSDGMLEKKEGIKRLPAGEKFSTFYSIKIF